MKSLTKTLFAFACLYAISTASLFAQIYTFDEFGNSSGTGITPGILQPDPSGGLAINVLVYNLPFPVIPGDVILSEGSPAGAGESDLVRFWDPTGAGPSQIIFYSDFSSSDPADAPADTGLPSGRMPLGITIPEIGPEGNNGAIYTPTANQPGFILSTALPPATYNIISDVPEPNAVATVALGGGILLSLFKRRQGAVTN